MDVSQKFEELKTSHFLHKDNAVLELFDGLEAVSCVDVLGKWKGGGFDTGHWLLQGLVDMNWFGKWFLSENDAKPLICRNNDGNLYSNTSLNGEACLRMIDFRGKASATVVYDGVPMFGHLRRIDKGTLLGVVDGKVFPTGDDIVQDGRHQFFYLERIQDWPNPFIA